MNSFTEDALNKAFEIITDIDKFKVRAAVKSAREQYPDLSQAALAAELFNRSRLKAAFAGFALGITGNPLAVIPVAMADITITTKLEVFTAACVAEIFEDGYLDVDSAKYELLVPVFGSSVLNQLAAELGVNAGKAITKDLIKNFLSKETLKQFKRVMLKYFGVKVSQKGVITKTLPIVGGLIGAGWNAVEASIVKRRVISHFSEQTSYVDVIVIDKARDTLTTKCNI